MRTNSYIHIYIKNSIYDGKREENEFFTSTKDDDDDEDYDYF